MNIFFFLLLIQISIKNIAADFCPDGYYGSDSIMCTACYDNYSSISGQNTDYTLCFPCPQNKSSISGSTCTPCPNNFYSKSGQSCQPCPKNQQSISGSSCTQCPSGYSSDSGSSCTITTYFRNLEPFLITIIAINIVFIF